MAFSTQKDFMDVGFMNTSLETVCSNNKKKLKTYPSSTDTRAWSLNNKQQAKFFADIVACRTYVAENENETNLDYETETNMDNIKDIKQLQDIINNLKKENAMLRAGDSNIGKGNKSTNTIALAENKSGMIPISEYNKIVEERNKLNDQLAKTIGLEDKIAKLKNRAMDADKYEDELKSLSTKDSGQHENRALRSQIDDFNCQCYENQRKIEDLQMQLRELNCLKQENNDLNNEFRMLTRKLERMQCLEEKLCTAEHQICCNERIIQDYEYQFNQLMMVIEELEGKPSCYCECDLISSVVKDGHLNDLTLATKATIDQIKLEMFARGKLQEEIHTSKIELANFQYKAKMDIDQLQKDRDDKLNDTSNKCADILKQLEKCREENKQLKKFVGEVKSGLIEELSPECLSEIGIPEVDDKQRKEIKPTDSEIEYMSEIEVGDINEYRVRNKKPKEYGVEKTDQDKPPHYAKIEIESDYDFETERKSSYYNKSAPEHDFEPDRKTSYATKPATSDYYDYESDDSSARKTDVSSHSHVGEFSILENASADEVRRKKPYPKIDEDQTPESNEYGKYEPEPDTIYKARKSEVDGTKHDDTSAKFGSEITHEGFIQEPGPGSEAGASRPRHKEIPPKYDLKTDKSSLREEDRETPTKYDIVDDRRILLDGATTDFAKSDDRGRERELAAKYDNEKTDARTAVDGKTMKKVDKPGAKPGTRAEAEETSESDTKAKNEKSSKSAESLFKYSSEKFDVTGTISEKIYDGMTHEPGAKSTPGKVGDIKTGQSGPKGGYGIADDGKDGAEIIDRTKAIDNENPELDGEKVMDNNGKQEVGITDDRKTKLEVKDVGKAGAGATYDGESGPGVADGRKFKESGDKFISIKSDSGKAADSAVKEGTELNDDGKARPEKDDGVKTGLGETDVRREGPGAIGKAGEPSGKYGPAKIVAQPGSDTVEQSGPGAPDGGKQPDLGDKSISGKTDSRKSDEPLKPISVKTYGGKVSDSEAKLDRGIVENGKGRHDIVDGRQGGPGVADNGKEAPEVTGIRKKGLGVSDDGKAEPIITGSGKSMPGTTDGRQAADSPDPDKIGLGGKTGSVIADGENAGHIKAVGGRGGRGVAEGGKAEPLVTHDGISDKQNAGGGKVDDRNAGSGVADDGKAGAGKVVGGKEASKITEAGKIGAGVTESATVGTGKAEDGNVEVPVTGKIGTGQLAPRAIAESGKIGAAVADKGKAGPGKIDERETGPGSAEGGKAPGKTEGGKASAGVLYSQKSNIGVTDSGTIGQGKSEAGETGVVEGRKAGSEVTYVGNAGTVISDIKETEPGSIDGGKAGSRIAEGGKIGAGIADYGTTNSTKANGGKTEAGILEVGNARTRSTDIEKEVPESTDIGKAGARVPDSGKAGPGKGDGGKGGPRIIEDGKAGTSVADGAKAGSEKIDAGKASPGITEDGKAVIPGTKKNSNEKADGGKAVPKEITESRKAGASSENTGPRKIEGEETGSGGAKGGRESGGVPASSKEKPANIGGGNFGPKITEGTKPDAGVADRGIAGPRKIDDEKTGLEGGGKVETKITEGGKPADGMGGTAKVGGGKVGPEVADFGNTNDEKAGPGKIDGRKTGSEVANGEKVRAGKIEDGKLRGEVKEDGKTGSVVAVSGKPGLGVADNRDGGKAAAGVADDVKKRPGVIDSEKAGSGPAEAGKTSPGTTDGRKSVAEVPVSGKRGPGKVDDVQAGSRIADGGKSGAGVPVSGKTTGTGKVDVGKEGSGITDGRKSVADVVVSGKTGTGKVDVGKEGSGKTNGRKSIAEVSVSGKTGPRKVEVGKEGSAIADGGKSGAGVPLSGKSSGPGEVDVGKEGSGKSGAELSDIGKRGPGKVDDRKEGSRIADGEKYVAGVPVGGETRLGRVEEGKARSEITDGGKTPSGKAGPGVAAGGKAGSAVEVGKNIGVGGKIAEPGPKLLPSTELKSSPEKISGAVGNDIDQCLKALEMLKKELRDAKEKHELEKNALEKKVIENQKLREKLEEENEKYKFQRQKSKELDKEKTDLESKQGNLQNKLTESREALFKQKEMLGQQNELLVASKAELEKQRGELIKSKEQIASLEALNKLSHDTNNKLNDDIKAKQQEIAALTDKIKELQDKISKLEENIKTGDSGTKSLTDELANLKKTIANLNEQVANKEASIKDANNKIKTLNSEKESINNELKNSRKDLNDIQVLVGDIESQRGKNKDLEALVKNYENKLSDIGTPIAITDINLQDAMNALKKQLQIAETKNNKLISELKESKGELEKLQNETVKSGRAVASDSASGAAGSSSRRKSASRNRPSPGMAPAAGDAKAPYTGSGLTQTSRSNVVAGVKQHVKSLEKRHSNSLLKLQNIYGGQMKDLVENHEKEIQALKMGEKKLRGTLTKIAGGESEDIKKLLYEIKNGMCTCKKSLCEMTKLQRICRKIIDQGIECLSVKELTHLHGEVYKAGLRLKPELLQHCDEKQKCCKCTDFSCCLPHLSKEMEKKLISRIIFLENEVDKANKILLHLKNNYTTTSTPNNYKFNDDLNDLLKTFCSNTYQKTNKTRCISCANLNNQNRKCKSARLTSKQRREFDIPTRD